MKITNEIKDRNIARLSVLFKRVIPGIFFGIVFIFKPCLKEKLKISAGPKIAIMNLCYAGFDRFDWLKIIEQPIRTH